MMVRIAGLLLSVGVAVASLLTGCSGGGTSTGGKLPNGTPSGGAVYYVAPNGNNSNPGTRERPWATPGYGSRQLRPGDTLIILGGRYVLREYDADIITPPSGTATAWITIKGEKKQPSYFSRAK